MVGISRTTPASSGDRSWLPEARLASRGGQGLRAVHHGKLLFFAGRESHVVSSSGLLSEGWGSFFLCIDDPVCEKVKVQSVVVLPFFGGRHITYSPCKLGRLVLVPLSAAVQSGEARADGPVTTAVFLGKLCLHIYSPSFVSK